MDAYEAETKEIFQRYRTGEITRVECEIRLDVAFAALMSGLSKYQAEVIRPTVAARNQSTLKRIAKSRRKVFWPNDSTSPPYYRTGVRLSCFAPPCSIRPYRRGSKVPAVLASFVAVSTPVSGATDTYFAAFDNEHGHERSWRD